MKKRFSAFWKLVSLLCAAMLLSGCQSPSRSIEKPVTLYVASDLHFLSEQLNDYGEAFKAMEQESDAKVMSYNNEIVDAFIGNVLQAHPDGLILSGDLTFNGEKLSHQDLAQKLSALEDAGIPVYVLPGNHDLNNPVAAKYEGNETVRTENIDDKEFEEIYGDMGYNEALSIDPDSLSYVAAVNDELRLLFIDVNTKDSFGTLKDETLAWIEEQLDQAHEDGAMVISVSHQNLIQHNMLLADGYVMGNHADLLHLLEDAGVLVQLSGHMHMQHSEQSPQGLYEIATSSLLVNPLQYGVIELEGSELDYQTKQIVLSDDISAYALEMMYESSYNMIYSKLEGVDEEERKELSEYIATINTNYFAGTLDDSMLDEALNKKWQQYYNQTSTYLASIVLDSSSTSDNSAITINIG